MLTMFFIMSLFEAQSSEIFHLIIRYKAAAKMLNKISYVVQFFIATWMLGSAS